MKFKCPHCDDYIKLKELPYGIKNMGNDFDDDINAINKILAKHFGNKNGMPLAIFANLLKALSGVEYPECELEDEDHE